MVYGALLFNQSESQESPYSLNTISQVLSILFFAVFSSCLTGSLTLPDRTLIKGLVTLAYSSCVW